MNLPWHVQDRMIAPGRSIDGGELLSNGSIVYVTVCLTVTCELRHDPTTLPEFGSGTLPGCRFLERALWRSTLREQLAYSSLTAESICAKLIGGRPYSISEGYSTEVEIVTQAYAWIKHLLGRAARTTLPIP